MSTSVRMTVDEREKWLSKLEAEIIALLSERTTPIAIPELLRSVARQQGAVKEDVAIALGRLSTRVKRSNPAAATVQLAR